MNNAVTEAAQELRIAETDTLACAPIRTKFEELSADQKLHIAYQIKKLNHQHWSTQRQPRGAKIGMTSAFIQEMFGLTQPDYGNLYQDMQLQSGDHLSLSQLIAPKLEVEWALELNQDMDQTPTSLDELMSCVANIRLAFEVVDSRIQHWDVQALDLIADNGSSGRYLVSRDSVKPSAIDLLQQSVTLERDAIEICKSSASESLGNPWDYAQWLIATYIEVGSPLRQGDVLFTGSLTPIQELTANETWTASTPEFGDISLTISE